MNIKHLAAFALLVLLSSGIRAEELGEQWSIHGGDWQLTREILPVVHQRGTRGVAAAFYRDPAASHGVWRTNVKLSQGTAEAGLWIEAVGQGHSGLQVLVGGESAPRGFRLQMAGDPGEVLWADSYAPWVAYHGYTIEAVVEPGRVRVQMLDAAGKLLISQSPWVSFEETMPRSTAPWGLFTTNGPARFYATQRPAEPLSPLVDDPPNKRRLIQNDDSPWLVLGDGNWMWLTSRGQKLQQIAQAERSWAIHRGIRGSHRTWECRVKVPSGTKGAGILFQTDDGGDTGFLAWLGGTYGGGALMLYQREPESCARWASKQDSWHYDTEYVLRAETRPGQVRIQQLAADGQTVISDSSWIQVDRQYTDREGCLGLHTWGGQADFWGFSEPDTTGE